MRPKQGQPAPSHAFAAVFCASVAFLALTATPAFAERAFDSQLTGLGGTTAITFDLADHLWIGHRAQGTPLISEYDAYPSQTKIIDMSGGGYLRGAAPEFLGVDGLNGLVYAGQWGAGHITAFDANGRFVSPQWTFETFGLEGGLAIDNSGGESNGIVYAGHTRGPFELKTIEAFTPDHRPVNFSSNEPDISGNGINLEQSLTGLTVDSLGNIYAGGAYGWPVAEFKPSGEFVQNFPISLSNGTYGNLAVDPTNGDLLVATGNVIEEFSPSGEHIGQITGTSPSTPFGSLPGAIAFNSGGYLYVSDGTHEVIDIFAPKAVVPRVAYPLASNTTSTSGRLNATIDPNGGGNVTSCHIDYGTTESFGLGTLPCLDQGNTEVGTPGNPLTSTTEVHVDLSGLTTDTTYYYRAVVGNANATRPGLIRRLTPRTVQGLHTDPPTNVQATQATLNGSFIGLGEDTHFYFQYGTDQTYGETTPIEDAGAGSGAQVVAPVTITGLQPAALYHYRIAASNSLGTTYGQDEIIHTLSQPTIEGLFTDHLLSSSAELHAKINPNGGDTHYHIDYGKTLAYGASTPEEDIGSSQETQSVTILLTGLEADSTYHFRVVAQSPFGTTVSEDQSFSFHPPDCPNAHIRQVTNSSYLPDCRAYELVSPADAGGTALFPVGVNSPKAVSPARFAFGGIIGQVPGSGDPINGMGDLYVATRTTKGWVTKYIGLPANEAARSVGPPNDEVANFVFSAPASVRTNTDMSEFLDWNGGFGSEYGWSWSGPEPPFDFTPHVFSADGTSLGEIRTVNGYDLEHSGIFDQSGDMTHYVFQVGEAPALSLIDYDRASGTTAVVSKTSSDVSIPIEPGDSSPNSESIRVPAVSTDGSHILMAARSGPSGGCYPNVCPLAPSHLYMRVNDTVTYDVSGQGHAVSYVGMTPDGTKVYFTTSEQLTPDDTDTSVDLYMWSQAGADRGEPLTLISKGVGGKGNTDACNTSWTTKCDVLPYTNSGYSKFRAYGSLMGNGLSDNSIAAENGDIYFFSPEQLAGAKGSNGEENLYDYREGHVQYVTTLNPAPFCVHEEYNDYCSDGPVIRMQVSPDDSHMAFLTASQVGPYNNAERAEMYTYDPANEVVNCVSCRPNGEPPTTDVMASSNGLFMTDDGRTFFSTGDALVPQDTDGLRDTYEYTEGHAQLISSGTTAIDRVRKGSEMVLGIDHELFTAGLVGVSPDGSNVYFSTYDRLVEQDQNGKQLRFYDARSGGGFPFEAPPTPCQAADECHGEGSSPEAAFANGTGAELGAGGNLREQRAAAHHRRRRRRHARRREAGAHASHPGRPGR